MDMLKLKGQTESGEWVEFWIYNMVRCNKMFAAAECIDPVLSEETFEVMNIITDTIQPADDPRKQMLDEIRQQINGLPGTDYSCAGDTVYIHQEVNRKRVSEIIDEMEAKL